MSQEKNDKLPKTDSQDGKTQRDRDHAANQKNPNTKTGGKNLARKAAEDNRSRQLNTKKDK